MSWHRGDLTREGLKGVLRHLRDAWAVTPVVRRCTVLAASEADGHVARRKPGRTENQ